MRDSTQEARLFNDMPILRSVLTLAIPTVISQIILVIYNMADTFFIGMTGSDAMLTSVTVCMPAFMFLSAISNLFGVGGASVIARSLGSGQAILCAQDLYFNYGIKPHLFTFGSVRPFKSISSNAERMREYLGSICSECWNFADINDIIVKKIAQA